MKIIYDGGYYIQGTVGEEFVFSDNDGRHLLQVQQNPEISCSKCYFKNLGHCGSIVCSGITYVEIDIISEEESPQKTVVRKRKHR